MQIKRWVIAKGYFQDIRISKKVVYNGCFLPTNVFFEIDNEQPNEPSCSEVLLQVQSDTTNVSDAVVDSSPNQYELTKKRSTQHIQLIKKYTEQVHCILTEMEMR